MSFTDVKQIKETIGKIRKLPYNRAMLYDSREWDTEPSENLAGFNTDKLNVRCDYLESLEESSKEALDALTEVFKKEGQMWISDLLKKHGRESDWGKLNGYESSDTEDLEQKEELEDERVGDRDVKFRDPSEFWVIQRLTFQDYYGHTSTYKEVYWATGRAGVLLPFC